MTKWKRKAAAIKYVLMGITGVMALSACTHTAPQTPITLFDYAPAYAESEKDRDLRAMGACSGQHPYIPAGGIGIHYTADADGRCTQPRFIDRR